MGAEGGRECVTCEIHLICFLLEMSGSGSLLDHYCQNTSYILYLCIL